MTREYLVDGPVPEGKAITVGQQIAATQVHIQIALAFRAPGTEVHPNHFQINARCGRAVVQDSRSPSDSRGQTFTPPVSWSRPWGGAFQVTLSAAIRDRKSTRLNSSHANISYAVFCLKKKKIKAPKYYT